MDFKRFKVKFTKYYIVETGSNASEEYVKKMAESNFNNEIQFGLINPINKNFNIEIIDAIEDNRSE